MTLLFDGLPLFINSDDTSLFSLDILKYISNFFEISIIKDSFIEADKSQKLSNILGNKISILPASIDRNLLELNEINKLSFEFEIYTCFNNGLGVPFKGTRGKHIIFLYSLLPFYKNNIQNSAYRSRFLSVVLENINSSKCTIVFSELHYNLALSCGVKKEKLRLVYPFVNKSFKSMDKLLAKAYLEARFNIKDDYLLCIGASNESFNLKMVLDFYKKFELHNSSMKIIFLMTYSSKKALKDFKEQLPKSLNLEVLHDYSISDQINFLGGATALVDFSSQYVLTLSKLKALEMEIPIISDLNPLNLEYFEDYPIYLDGDEISLEKIYHKKETSKELIKGLKNKFPCNIGLEKIINIYKGE